MNKRFSILTPEILRNKNINFIDNEKDEIIYIENFNIKNINSALRILKGKYVFLLSPDIYIYKDSLFRFEQEFLKEKDIGFIYSNYIKNKKEKKLFKYTNDWTERWNFGNIRIYNVEALKESNFFSEDYPLSYQYDMLLNYWMKKKIIFIPEYLYEINSKENDNSLKNKLYFPTEGDFGGFSYLFYSDEKNNEINKIFENFLKREKIYFDKEPMSKFSEDNKKNSIKVSVIIPVFNRAGFISTAIESVINQNINEWEIIIVDNASTDNTCEIVDKYIKEDSRIKLIKRTENHIAHALNDGIKEAKGKYIAQLDSDDKYSENTLLEMTSALDENISAGLAVSYYDLIDEDEKNIKDMGIIKHEEYSVNNILRVDGAGAVRVWRKAAIVEMGYFNETDFADYGEDYDMVLKVTEKYSLTRVHKVLYHYRRHAGNSDVLREEEYKLNTKNKARFDAYKRRQNRS